MNVVRENSREFLRTAFYRKCETRFSARRRIDVTDRADGGAIAAEEITAVTSDTRSMSGIIGNVRVASGGSPIRCRIFMTRTTVDLFVRRRRVRKIAAPSLRRNRVPKTRRKYKCG